MVYPYLKNATQLLTVQWGQTVNWDVRFEGAPAPFNEWFPAHGLDRRLVSIERMEIPGPIVKTAIPAGEEPRELTINFYDDDKDTLRNWMLNWMADLSTNGLAIVTVKEACKKLNIAHIDRLGNQTTFSSLFVWPTGALTETFGSGTQNAIKGFTVNFVVAGSTAGARVGYPPDDQAASGLTKTITPNTVNPGQRPPGPV